MTNLTNLKRKTVIGMETNEKVLKELADLYSEVKTEARIVFIGEGLRGYVDNCPHKLIYISGDNGKSGGLASRIVGVGDKYFVVNKETNKDFIERLKGISGSTVVEVEGAK